MGIKKLELNDIIKDNQNIVELDSTYYSLTKAFPLKIITNSKENDVALAISERLINFLNSSKNSPTGMVEYLKTLTVMIHEYEEKSIKKKEVSGRALLAYLMELHDLKQTDLANEVGGQSVVSELLKGNRAFNTRQITALAKRFGVDASLFIGE